MGISARIYGLQVQRDASSWVHKKWAGTNDYIENKNATCLSF